MKILVTGHEGFIGQNMMKYLANQGHEVRGYEWGDTFYSVERLDCVIHLGAISSTTERNIEKVLEQNLDFSIMLLNQCEKYNVKFQYASSASVYGPNENFEEYSPLYPQSPYAWSKYLFDRYVRENKFNITVQGFRYFNVYGKGEDHKGEQASPVTKFTKQAKETKKINLFEKSENYYRDFVCVDDVCKIHEAFFDIKESGIWNVGTGIAHSFKEIAEAIAEKENAQIIEIPMPADLKNQYQKYTCADLTKLNQLVNIDWTNIIDWIKK